MSTALTLHGALLLHRDLTEQYPNHVVFVRMGDVYVTFNQDAEDLKAVFDYTVGYFDCSLALEYERRLVAMGRDVLFCDVGSPALDRAVIALPDGQQ